MNRLVLKIILRLDRYAILPVVALACVILAVWLLAMDRYTITALVAAPFVFSIFLGAVAPFAKRLANLGLSRHS